MSQSEAEAMDASDPLAFARQRFQLADDLIYLDGNSLGALPRATPAAVLDVVERHWGRDLIASWNKHHWIDWPRTVAERLAPIVGASPHELLIVDSTTVSLFKLLAAAARARPGRRSILTAQSNFPTDIYVAQGLAEMLGMELRLVEAEKIGSAITDEIAVVSLSHVEYRSAALMDMRSINAAAHDAGALTIWDLSHSAGAVEVDLLGTHADLAVGCGYKYLNGGPGAPAFIYVAEQLQENLDNAVAGWMGHDAPFAFTSEYRPASGICRFQSGTPPILALAALKAGLDTFEGVSVDELAAKSRSLSELFIRDVEGLAGNEVQLASPRDPARRGSHVVFAHDAGYAVVQALIARGVIGDFREPNLMRFGFAPLYTSHAEVSKAAVELGQVLASGEWDQARFRERAKVT